MHKAAILISLSRENGLALSARQILVLLITWETLTPKISIFMVCGHLVLLPMFAATLKTVELQLSLSLMSIPTQLLT